MQNTGECKFKAGRNERVKHMQANSEPGYAKTGTAQLTLHTRFVKTLRLYYKYRFLLLMMLPAVILYILFKYAPMYGVMIAFKDYKINRGILGSKWVGLDNFQYLFGLDSFRDAIRNTFIISFYKLIYGFPVPIIFAVLLNEIRQIHFKKVVQTVSYLPHFISWVILSGIFLQFLSPSVGPVNIVLDALGFKKIFFLADPKWFRFILVVTSIWKGVGWSSIVYLASLAGIDPELYEAAWVDGANRFRRIWHVTLPGLIPVITIMLIFAVGQIVNDDFDQIFNLYNTRVYSVADVISTYTYRMGLIDIKYSLSTAVGLFRNVVALLLIASTNAIARRVNDYSLW